ncbi:MAG: hypothetical protein R3A44_21855 [Caldilineaceae bacterium]
MLTAEHRNMAESLALFTLQQPVDDLTREQRRHQGRLRRRIQKLDQAHHSIEQSRIQRAYILGSVIDEKLLLI